MVNFQFNLASISGIILAVGGAALYAVRSFRPQLSRDSDIFFSAVGLLCGLILIFYGWRFDPIMQFGQVLLTGAAIFFVIENLRLRQISTEQAKRTTPIVDDDRPVSRTYKADFDDDYSVRFDAGRDRSGRIPASRDSSGDLRSNRDDEYERPIPRSTSRSGARLNPADRSRRRSRSDDALFDDVNDNGEDWESRPSRARDTSARSSRPRPRNSRVEDINSVDDAGYVDYRPIDSGDRGKDSWGE